MLDQHHGIHIVLILLLFIFRFGNYTVDRDFAVSVRYMGISKDRIMYAAFCIKH